MATTIPDSTRRRVASTVRTMSDATIRSAYPKWPDYNRRLRDVVAGVDRRAARASSPSPGALAALGDARPHRLPARVLAVRLRRRAGRRDDAVHERRLRLPGRRRPRARARAPTELVDALDSTFRIVERCLDRWTVDVARRGAPPPGVGRELGPHPRRGDPAGVRHDVSHITELNEALGRGRPAAGRPLGLGRPAARVRAIGPGRGPGRSGTLANGGPHAHQGQGHRGQRRGQRRRPGGYARGAPPRRPGRGRRRQRGRARGDGPTGGSRRPALDPRRRHHGPRSRRGAPWRDCRPVRQRRRPRPPRRDHPSLPAGEGPRRRRRSIG